MLSSFHIKKSISVRTSQHLQPSSYTNYVLTFLIFHHRHTQGPIKFFIRQWKMSKTRTSPCTSIQHHVSFWKEIKKNFCKKKMLPQIQNPSNHFLNLKLSNSQKQPSWNASIKSEYEIKWRVNKTTQKGKLRHLIRTTSSWNHINKKKK